VPDNSGVAQTHADLRMVVRLPSVENPPSTPRGWPIRCRTGWAKVAFVGSHRRGAAWWLNPVALSMLAVAIEGDTW